MKILVGLDKGLVTIPEHSSSGEVARLVRTAPRATVQALARDEERWWAISADRSILHSSAGGEWQQIAATDPDARCLAPHPGGLLVGTADAHVFRVRDGALDLVESFEEVEGRDSWYTPWGGPPDTRSISVDGEGTIYVNVHVGGVVRSRDGGKTWEPTMDIDMDVHQVQVHPARTGAVFAPSARGLGITEDAGRSWRFDTEGLHATYCRAVAVCEDSVLVSASTGPRSKQAAVYRRSLNGSDSFEKCRTGLPEWFDGNVNTFCLIASDKTAAFGTESGDVHVSTDQGKTWDVAASGLTAVRCVAFA